MSSAISEATDIIEAFMETVSDVVSMTTSAN